MTNKIIKKYRNIFNLGWKNKLPSNNNKSIVFINLLLLLLIVSFKLAFFRKYHTIHFRSVFDLALCEK